MLFCIVLFCIVLYSYMHCIALYCYINSNYYLSPGDRMTIFRCSRNSSSNLGTSIVKHRSIVIHIKNINPHYRLPLPGTPAPFPLDVERVEEQRHLLGGLVGGGLQRLWVLRSTKQRMNWKRCNFSKQICFSLSEKLQRGIPEWRIKTRDKDISSDTKNHNFLLQNISNWWNH